MKTLLWLIAGIFAVVPFAAAAWYFYVRRRLRNAIMEKYQKVAPLIHRLAKRELVTPAQMEVMARDPTLRHAIFRVLEAYGQMELFPREFATLEKGAESFLVSWLEFPTELGKPPDEIELMTTITLHGEINNTYYVFRFRMLQNHWASKFDWLLGVVGPYSDDSAPFDMPAKIFSRFKSASGTTAKDEVLWVHHNVA